MRLQITNITDKSKLKYKRLFYAQGTEVLAEPLVSHLFSVGFYLTS